MMSRLAAVPPSTIRQMSAMQWEYAANCGLPFFYFVRRRCSAFSFLIVTSWPNIISAIRVSF